MYSRIKTGEYKIEEGWDGIKPSALFGRPNSLDFNLVVAEPEKSTCCWFSSIDSVHRQFVTITISLRFERIFYGTIILNDFSSVYFSDDKTKLTTIHWPNGVGFVPASSIGSYTLKATQRKAKMPKLTLPHVPRQTHTFNITNTISFEKSSQKVHFVLCW